MYIPTANFSSQGSCVTASVSYISGSGNITSGSFVSQSITWSYIQFENTANLTSVSSSFIASLNIPGGYSSQVKLLLVGGGGAGGLGATVPCPTSFADTAGGGGGGGGTVYIDTFALYSGSFEICVGAGGGPAAQATRRSGLSSYIKLPNGDNYPVFGNQITAGGGGRGGYVSGPCGAPYGNQGADSGASGGGASRPLVFAQTFGGNGGGVAGLTGGSQGFEGGDCLNGIAGIQYDVQGAGGGGSAAAAANANFPTSNTRVTAGGDGKSFSITGTSLTYGGGGGGAVLRGFPNTFNSGANGSCTSGFGAGGRAGANFSGNPATDATSGVVIIAWPKCEIAPVPIPSGSFPASASVIYDFGNTNSYPTSGSIVYDLSGNAVNGTLTGSSLPAYSASNGGIIRLDSSQLQYVNYSGSFTPNATVVTIWKNFNSTFLVDSGLPDAAMSYGIKAATIGGTKQYTPILYDNGGNSNTFSGATLTPNNIDVWHQYATVVNSSGTNSTATTYLDEFAIATQSKSFNRSGTSGSGSVFIGNDRDVVGRYANGYLMGYLQYNRDLTSIELNQIYTTFSSRF